MMADCMIKMPRQWGKYRGGVSKIPQRQQGHALKYVEVISNTAAVVTMNLLIAVIRYVMLLFVLFFKL
jgi:hypothetical protein